jgi:ankyrin repeat protein
VKLLIEHKADVDLLDGHRCSALHRAVQCCNYDVVVYLLEHGADPDIPSKDGPPLQIACSVGDIETILALLDHNATINQSFNGKTAMHLAVMNYRHDILKILLSRGGDPDAADAQGNTCLHLAAWLTQENVIQILLENGATVDIPNRLRETPLQRAAEIGAGSVFEMLLHAGADMNARDRVGRTPLDWAKMQDHTAIFDARARWQRSRTPQADKGMDLLGLGQFADGAPKQGQVDAPATPQKSRGSEAADVIFTSPAQIGEDVPA